MAFQHWGNWGGPGWSDGHKTYPGENINWDGPYFSFAGIPTQFTSWHLDALRLIAPVLNDLFLNYIAYGKKESAVFLSKLTCRQTEIVRLTARGKNGKSIALELCISEKTVRNQLTSIYAELGVRSRFELMNLLR